MSNPLKDILVGARALIADEDDWITKHLAKDQYGEPISITDPGACMFCGMGAVKRVANELGYDHKIVLDIFAALADAGKEVTAEEHPHSITYINDVIGHAAVIQTFDIAIARIK